MPLGLSERTHLTAGCSFHHCLRPCTIHAQATCHRSEACPLLVVCVLCQEHVFVLWAHHVRVKRPHDAMHTLAEVLGSSPLSQPSCHPNLPCVWARTICLAIARPSLVPNRIAPLTELAQFSDSGCQLLPCTAFAAFPASVWLWLLSRCGCLISTMECI